MLPDGLGDEDGVVPLKGAGVLLVGGHERLSNAYLIGPDAKGRVLRPLPESLKRVSGVPLMDGSIVVFGGLPGELLSQRARSLFAGRGTRLPLAAGAPALGAPA